MNIRPCRPQNRTTVYNGNDADRTREVIHLMRRLMQAGERYTKELNKKFSVSAPQVASLLALLDDGSMSPSQIAKKIMVESSTVTGIIDRLEQKGLVARTRISQDRRVITVELTEAGRRLAENAPPPIQQKIVKGLRKVDESERAQIIQTLNRLTDMIDADDVDEEDEAVIV
jgi:DNA-binding MarR family transcriptional regulator